MRKTRGMKKRVLFVAIVLALIFIVLFFAFKFFIGDFKVFFGVEKEKSEGIVEGGKVGMGPGTPAQLAVLRSDNVSCQQPVLPNANYLSSFIDPCFNTNVTNIGPVPGMTHYGLNVTSFYPHYSRIDAWNIDNSLIMLYSSNGWGQILNGITYEHIFEPSIGFNDNTRWSEKDPNIIYLFPGSSLREYNVSSRSSRVIISWPEYSLVGQLSEGNFDKNNRYVALVGQGSGPSYKQLEAFVYDFETNTTGPRFNISATGRTMNWVSMSYSGEYVLAGWNPPSGTARYQGVEIFDKNMTFLRQITTGYSHGDTGVDEDGSDIYVTSSDPPSFTTEDYNFYFKYRLYDGNWTPVGYFEYEPKSGDHISLRNLRVPGWALISHYDTTIGYYYNGWDYSEQEIFALKLDGSREVRRIAHHHSFWPFTFWNGTAYSYWDGDYWAEPHATVNKDFTKVIFGTNWVDLPDSNAQNKSTYHYAYVVDLGGVVYADTTAPVISLIVNNSITNLSAVISWQTNENANSRVYYGLSAVNLNLNAADAGYLLSHIINLNNLGENSTYYYKVRSCDVSGNCANSTIYEFKTLANETYVDRESPEIVLEAPTDGSSLGESSVAFTYVPADYSNITNCTFYIGVETRIDNTIEKNVENSFVLSLANGNYSWNVSCIDSWGNIGESETRKFGVSYQAPSDTQYYVDKGSSIVVTPKPKAENVTNVSVSEEVEKIILGDELNYVDLVNGEEKIIVDLYGNSYLVSFILTEDGKIVAKLFNGDYIIPRKDVLPISLGGGEMYVGIVEGEEQVVLGLDANAVGEKAGKVEGGGDKSAGKFKIMYYALIGVVGILIIVIIVIIIWYARKSGGERNFEGEKAFAQR